jgi:hypothetical protein
MMKMTFEPSSEKQRPLTPQQAGEAFRVRNSRKDELNGKT